MVFLPGESRFRREHYTLARKAPPSVSLGVLFQRTTAERLSAVAQGPGRDRPSQDRDRVTQRMAETGDGVAGPRQLLCRTNNLNQQLHPTQRGRPPLKAGDGKLARVSLRCPCPSSPSSEL